jgi:hypothetical protein
MSIDQTRGKPRIQNIEITHHEITLQSLMKSPYTIDFNSRPWVFIYL